MPSNPDLIQRVVHPKVTEGKWVSEYHKPTPPTSSDWRLASELPHQYDISNNKFEPKYTNYVDMIADMFSLLVDFKLEAWREHKSTGLHPEIGFKMFDLIYQSSGSSPQKVPFWGPAKIDLPKVFRINSLSQEQILPEFRYGQDPWLKNTKKDRHYTNVWIAKPETAPFPYGMHSELKELVHVIGLPFHFYKQGEWNKPVGTDPFRMHLQIGVGDYMPDPVMWKVMKRMLADGSLDQRDLKHFQKLLDK